jgi:Mitochondrial branched-chain alpha-ketoacid dehydrogenase kinase
MSANAAARRLAMKAKEMSSTRYIATLIRAPPKVPFISLIQDVERSNLANLFQSKPPCGWRKSIVNSNFFSASAMSNDASAEPVLEDENSANRGYTSTEHQSQLSPLQVDMEELRALASQRCTALKLADMYKYAVDFNDQKQRLSNAQFLHRELPIRIAQRAIDLLTLPHGLSEAAPIQQVAHYYLQYLVLFQEFPVPTTSDEEERFTELLQGMVLDRTSIPNAVAQGVSTWVASNERTEGFLAIDRLQEMEDALYRFFTARVGLRFLTEHHILSAPKRMQNGSHQRLKEAQSPYNDVPDSNDKNVFLGCIQTDCNPTKEVRKVAEEVARQTKEHFGMCPAIEIVDATRSNKNVNFTYVPHHLHYMVGELIKNSCRATVRK